MQKLRRRSLSENEYVTKSLWNTKNAANDQMFNVLSSGIAELKGLTKDIHKIVAGNGEVGLCGKVDANSKEIKYTKEKIKDIAENIADKAEKTRDRIWQLVVKFAPYIGMAVLAYIAAKSNGTIK
jgi:hypothetical protein